MCSPSTRITTPASWLIPISRPNSVEPPRAHDPAHRDRADAEHHEHEREAGHEAQARASSRADAARCRTRPRASRRPRGPRPARDTRAAAAARTARARRAAPRRTPGECGDWLRPPWPREQSTRVRSVPAAARERAGARPAPRRSCGADSETRSLGSVVRRTRSAASGGGARAARLLDFAVLRRRGHRTRGCAPCGCARASRRSRRAAPASPPTRAPR